MSNDTHKADQIAFHFYTKLFYAVNHARATEETGSNGKIDKWFNLETPDSDLFTKEAREPYRNISLAPPPMFEIQVLLSVPELTSNQVLVHMSPDSSRVRIEPTARFIVLETWKLEMTPASHQQQHSPDVALPIIYKHGIILFRSVFSLLRVQPAWKFYKRLKRRSNRLGIKLRVRSEGESMAESITLGFDDIPSPTHRSPLPTSTHIFPPVPHLLGSFTLSTTYLTTPDFQLDELESLLSSRFISLDLQGFQPTLDKNRQRDSMSGSSLPNSSGIRSASSRSPPRQIGRATSGNGNDNTSVADRFILPARVASLGASSMGNAAAPANSSPIPPPRPFPTGNTSNASIIGSQPQSQPSGLAIVRIRKESLNSLSSSIISNKDAGIGGTSSLSSSPVSGALPIRRPNINQVHPFKSNTFSSASGSSPSLSIRQAPGSLHGGPTSPVGLPSSLSGGTAGPSTHSRQASLTASPVGNPARLPPSPMNGGFGVHPSPPGAISTFSPSSLGDRRPGTSGSNGSSDRDRRVSITSTRGVGDEPTEEGRGPMPMPQRKRYSSSFGHRYGGSVGSAPGVPSSSSGQGASPGVGGIGTGGSTPGSVNESSRGTPGSGGLEGKKEGVASFLSTHTDDDDISIFVQEIDSRKPLSGRAKEKEKRDRDREEQDSHYDHGHDRISTDATVKANQRERSQRISQDEEPNLIGQRPSSEIFSVDDAIIPYTTSPSPLNTYPISSGLAITGGSSADSSERAAQLSTSPQRGPMLTNQLDVEERLKKMNETFLKSLEGISSNGSQRRKEKQKVGSVDVVSPGGREESQEKRYSSSAGSSSDNSRASRGIGLGLQMRGAGDRDYPFPSPHTPSLGLGLGRTRQASTSSSTLATSDTGASQGSEEVIGRMDFYEERRRSGHQS